MSQAFAFPLGLKIQKTDVKAQKINTTTLKINEIVVFTFFILNKEDRERFFKKNLLLADIKPNIVLDMIFLTMCNIVINFEARDLE